MKDKYELEKRNQELDRKLQFYYLGIIKLRKELKDNLSIFKNGLAEESEYNNGVKNFLNWFTNFYNNNLVLYDYEILETLKKPKLFVFKSKGEK